MATKVGIIGAGGMVRYHIEGVRAAGAEVVAIADLNQAAAQSVADAQDIPQVFGDVAEMLALPDVEAVTVIVPNKFHAPIAIQSLQAGKHVFCEKPPALHAAEVVQRFGRELVTTWFQDSDGPHYLVRLAEHPAPAVQLFVSGMLSQHAAGNPDRVRELMPYFASVLTRVNAGRAAKRRVAAFLRDEALASEPAAHEVAALASRLTATPLITDRAEMVELLRDIGARFPGVDCGLRVVAPERRAPRHGSA